ncbi:MAG: aspartate kinase, partial [Flavobacteriales bacterium]
EVDEGQSIICVVGDMVYERTGTARSIFDALGNIPVRMIAYGGSRNNLSLLVDGEWKASALNALHQGVFGKKEGDVD